MEAVRTLSDQTVHVWRKPFIDPARAEPVDTDDDHCSDGGVRRVDRECELREQCEDRDEEGAHRRAPVCAKG